MVKRNLEADSLPVAKDLLVEQLKQASREELKILDNWLFWWPWSFECFWGVVSSPHNVLEIGIHSIVGFPLSLGWSNPIQLNLRLRSEIFPLKGIQGLLLHIAVNCESPQAAFPKCVQLLLLLRSLPLSTFKQFVNVNISQLALLA